MLDNVKNIVAVPELRKRILRRFRTEGIEIPAATSRRRAWIPRRSPSWPAS